VLVGAASGAGLPNADVTVAREQEQLILTCAARSEKRRRASGGVVALPAPEGVEGGSGRGAGLEWRLAEGQRCRPWSVLHAGAGGDPLVGSPMFGFGLHKCQVPTKTAPNTMEGSRQGRGEITHQLLSRTNQTELGEKREFNSSPTKSE